MHHFAHANAVLWPQLLRTVLQLLFVHIVAVGVICVQGSLGGFDVHCRKVCDVIIDEICPLGGALLVVYIEIIED